jgi:general secretion pathway protein G
MEKNKNKKNGFTLIELLTAVAIIGILSSITLVSVSVHKEKSRDARRISELNSIKDAIELYFEENGSFPNTLTEISSSFDGVLPKDPKTGAQYQYLKIPATPPQPKQYCLLAQLEYLDSVGTCSGSIPDLNLPKRYVIQGPL